jgi:hypothetical protein
MLYAFFDFFYLTKKAHKFVICVREKLKTNNDAIQVNRFDNHTLKISYFPKIQTHLFFLFDCYPKGAGFDFRLMLLTLLLYYILLHLMSGRQSNDNIGEKIVIFLMTLDL